MITNNYKKIFGGMLGNENQTVIDIGGNSRSISYGSSSGTSSNFMAAGTYIGSNHLSAIPVGVQGGVGVLPSYNTTGYYSAGGDIIITLGTGTTAPTESDYNLESPVALKAISVTHSTIKNDGVIVGVKYSVQYQNSTGGSLDISEVGAAMMCPINSSSKYRFLIDRTVLDSPITLEESEIITASYNFIFS